MATALLLLRLCRCKSTFEYDVEDLTATVMVLVYDGCDKQIDIIMKMHEIQLRNNDMTSELHEYFLMLPGNLELSTQLHN